MVADQAIGGDADRREDNACCQAIEIVEPRQLAHGEREIWLLSHRDASSIRRFKLVAASLAQQLATDDAFLAGIDEK